MIIKTELGNNVDILSSYIRMNKIQQKNFWLVTKTFNNGNNRLINCYIKCQDEDFFLGKNLKGLRKKINGIQQQLYQLNEETKNVRNQKLVAERDIMALEDNIKNITNLFLKLFRKKNLLKILLNY